LAVDRNEGKQQQGGRERRGDGVAEWLRGRSGLYIGGGGEETLDP
jgi:hypothetical protein